MRALPSLLLCAAASALTVHPAGPLSRDAGVRKPAQDTSLAAIAALIHQAGPAVDSVWPGFWPGERSFMLLRPRTETVLVTRRPPPAEYAALTGGVPPGLRGLVYRHRDYPADLGHAGLATRYVVGGDTLPAVAPLGATLAGRLLFFYHEAFHGHQHRAFAPEPAPSFSSVDPGETGAAFGAAAQAEREVLLAALEAPDRVSTLALAKRYLEMRSARLALAPTAEPVERAVELVEGTAEFVGCRAAAAAAGTGDGGLGCVRRWLERPLEEWPNAPERNARMMRWRLYGTGAAILVLADRLGASGWRARLMQGGVSPVDILTDIGR
jgi:hypothetical protein